MSQNASPNDGEAAPDQFADELRSQESLGNSRKKFSYVRRRPQVDLCETDVESDDEE